MQTAGVTSGPGQTSPRASSRPGPTLSARWRYRFDNLLARGTAALIVLLAILSALIILIASLIVVVTRVAPSGTGFLDLIYKSLLHAMDTGTVAGDTGSPWFLLVMVLVTVGGIFIVSALIGIITTGLDKKLAELRRGRSIVLEDGHTLILGWSPQIFAIISELVVANQNQRKSRIVVLADRDKVEIEDEIRAKVPHLNNTKVICRSGNPLDLADLEIGNPGTARSIIILSPEVDDPDTHVIMTLLAIAHNPNRRAEPYHIVAQIQAHRNLEVAEMVGGDEAQLVLGDDLIARITVQTCRQSGLSLVYTELLDFEGDEIYFQNEPRLTGKTFGEALMAYEDSAVIGIQRADGSTQLNPPMDTRFEGGDSVIAISEDDDTVRLNGVTPQLDLQAIQERQTVVQEPERTLILGWNSKLPTIVRELDSYVAPGSSTTVVTSTARDEDEITHSVGSLQNHSVSYQRGDIADREVLDRLDVSAYQHVIVLSDGDIADAQQADARTLITLLHLRDIEERLSCNVSIVSEMLDVRNRELAEVTHADDFVVSDQLVSLMMTQIAENRSLKAVFSDIFDSEGSEIYLKPAEGYVVTDRPVTFYTVVEAARRRGEVAIGYRRESFADDPAAQYGVTVNPRKSEQVRFEGADSIIVIAES